MSPQSQPQGDSGVIACPQCGTNNAAANSLCVTCRASLGEKSGNGSKSSTSSDIVNVVVGALTLGAAAYKLWKTLRGPASTTSPEVTETQSSTRATASTPQQKQPPLPALTRSKTESKKPVPQRAAPDELVDGWVTAIIRHYPLAPRLIKAPQEQFELEWPVEVNITGVPFPYYPPKQKRYSAAEYAPPTALFACIVEEYPSGYSVDWNATPVEDLDILWVSKEFLDRRTSPQSAPPDIPELRKIVDGFVQKAVEAGWELAGRGQNWHSYRLRKQYNEIGAPLKWK